MESANIRHTSWPLIASTKMLSIQFSLSLERASKAAILRWFKVVIAFKLAKMIKKNVFIFFLLFVL